jgi:hypothetical protein
VDSTIEKFTASTNKWEIINIPNAPSLASFGWTEGSTANELYILGGSNGLNLMQNLWKIDFET